jgi:hypothetical protein
MAEPSDVSEQAKRFAEQSELLRATTEVAGKRSAWEDARQGSGNLSAGARHPDR